MNNTIAVVIVVLVVLVGGYFLFMNNGSSGAPAQSSSQTAAPAPEASAATVSIQNFAFSPATLAVKTGTTVTWTNNDSTAHTVTSDSGGLLNSSTLAPGQSFTFTFTTPGSVSYHCAIHPTMKGTITVTS